MAGLPRSQVVAWLVLYRSVRDGKVRISAGNVARVGGMSYRSAVNALTGLRRRGLITVLYQGGLNRGPSTYRVNASTDEP